MGEIIKFYKDDITGSYYCLENGELVQYAMDTDNKITGTSCVVDWDSAMFEMPLTVGNEEIDIVKHLRKIEKILSR